MSEIEKLYRLSNIEPFIHNQPVKDYNFGGDNGYQYNEVKYYPSFTAEKQIELIKWLMAKAKDYQYDVENGKYWFIIDDYRETKYRDFDEALAELITLYWQDLTETEQEEIRKILKG